jgi:hypothetical protein
VTKAFLGNFLQDTLDYRIQAMSADCLGCLGQRFFQVARRVAGAVCGTDAELEDTGGGRAQPADGIVSAAGRNAPQGGKQFGRLDLA